MSGRLVALASIAIAAMACRGKETSQTKQEPPPSVAAADAQRTLPEDPFLETRLEMVERTIVRPLHSPPVTDQRVLTAMRLTPRHEFVPPSMRHEAYADRPMQIGFGLTISQPYIVAMMTEAARVKPGDRVLEIGTGSGYQAAVLAMMGAKVWTIEIHPELGERTKAVLQTTGFKDVQMKVADGWYGWPDAAPFDAILVTCASPIIPDRLLAQLKDGGRMVLPLGELSQTLEVVEKIDDDDIKRTELMDVRFGLMTGVVEAER